MRVEPKITVTASSPVTEEKPVTFPMLPKTGERSKKVGKTRGSTRQGDYDFRFKNARATRGPWLEENARRFVPGSLSLFFFLTIPGFVGFAKIVLPPLGCRTPKRRRMGDPGLREHG